MYFALLYYPRIELEEFQKLRSKYDPWAYLMPEHVPFIFPLPKSIGIENLKNHIYQILAGWKPITVHFCGLQKSWDQFLLLSLKEGNDQVIKLHNDFYTGFLSPYQREDLPFTPHVGLGLFSKEKYDINNPAAQLTLNEKRYQEAKLKYEGLKLDFWRRIDHLTLVKLNSDFSKSQDIMNFEF